jgi:hypothetical protein
MWEFETVKPSWRRNAFNDIAAKTLQIFHIWQTHTLHTFAAGMDQLIFVIKANLIMEEISEQWRESAGTQSHWRTARTTHTAQAFRLMIMA